MILGLGVDVVEIERMQRLLERQGERLVRRILTEVEQSRLPRRNPAVYLAGRWAAKEAVVKALGTGFYGVGWREVSVEKSPSGAPALQLYKTAAKVAALRGIRHWTISLSHERAYAVAVAAGEGEPPADERAILQAIREVVRGDRT
ncbi:MAG: holo-ACP synthase [Firmicutes bacterium]|nr:holo-ACP synthase [Bacillota bacterium]